MLELPGFSGDFRESNSRGGCADVAMLIKNVWHQKYPSTIKLKDFTHTHNFSRSQRYDIEIYMGVSENRGGTPKWMVYKGKPY